MLSSADVANRIRALAKTRGLKLGELLVACGTTPDLLSTMRKNYPRLDTIQAIAERLGVSLSDLISEEDLVLDREIRPTEVADSKTDSSKEKALQEIRDCQAFWADEMLPKYLVRLSKMPPFMRMAVFGTMDALGKMRVDSEYDIPHLVEVWLSLDKSGQSIIIGDMCRRVEDAAINEAAKKEA